MRRFLAAAGSLLVVALLLVGSAGAQQLILTTKEQQTLKACFDINGNFTLCGGSGSGTVTQINTTLPITGGPITTTGTIGILDFIASGASHARGAVPDPGVTPGATKFLREDATWAVPAGSGLSGSGTAPDLAIWATSSSLANYAGTSCSAGNAIRVLSAAGTATCIAITGSGTVGPGTTNVLAKFTAATAVGDSRVSDDGSIITATTDFLDVGHDNVAVGTTLSQFVIGQFNDVTGSVNTYRIGDTSSGIGDTTFIAGFNNTVNSNSYTVVGRDNTVSGAISGGLFGDGITHSGAGAGPRFSFGYFLTNTGTDSFAFGEGGGVNCVTCFFVGTASIGSSSVSGVGSGWVGNSSGTTSVTGASSLLFIVPDFASLAPTVTVSGHNSALFYLDGGAYTLSDNNIFAIRGAALRLVELATGGAAQCLQVGTAGNVTATGSACGGAGSTPGGANTQVQFNDSGAFGGNAGLTFVKATGRLTAADLTITNQNAASGQNCLQISTTGVVTKTGSACGSGTGTVTTTGSPASGNLTKFSGATSITNGDLTGDVTTSGTLATTLSTTGVSAGTYGQVTVDTKGRVTAGTVITDVPHGGTGLSIVTPGGLLLGAGGSPFTVLAPGGSNFTLHGSTPPTWSRVVLGAGGNVSSDVIGNLPVGNLNSGIGASASTFWRGDGTWATLVATGAAGSTGQVQFNTAGAFNADANFNWDNTNKRLGLGTASPTTQLQMTGDLTATGLSWTGNTGPAPRLIMLENGAPMLGDNTVITGWRPYMRLIENNVNNAQKTQLYIENVNTQTTRSVTSLTSAAFVATATTSGNHNYQTGYTVKISGAVPSAYNGEFTITVTGLTTFNYSFAGGTSPATGTILAQQAQINSGIAIFHYSAQDNGHEVSGIVSTESGAGNAGTFQRLAATPLGGLPMVTLSRQFGFAIEFNCNGNTTCMIGGNSDNGLSAAHGVGSLAGPPWPEGLRIYPVATALNLDQRVAIRVTATPDNLDDTTNDVFKVMLNGGTLIQSNSGLSNHLTIEGLGANGANIRLIGNGGGADSKTVRVAGGVLQVLNSAYTNVLFQLDDAGTSPTFPQLTGGATVPVTISSAGVILRGPTGLSTTKTVRAAGGAADCTLIYTNGILTGGSC